LFLRLLKIKLKKIRCIRLRNIARIGRTVDAAALAVRINELITAARSKSLANLHNATSKELWAKVGGKGRSSHNMHKDILVDADFVNEHFASIAFDSNAAAPLFATTSISSNASMNESRDNCVVEYDACTIEHLLRKTKKTSPGPDDIPYWFFCKCSYELTEIVTYLFNMSLTLGVVPRNWHIANVTPIPKLPKPCTIADFRPISVTPILSRVLERLVVRDYLLPAMPHEMLNDQFGFKPTGSTTCALTYLMHHVTLMLEASPYVRCFMIDFAKAFDQVNHAILISKLCKLSLPAEIISWVVSFLTDRSQVAKLDTRFSRAKPINQGVVQGSAIGPFLFLLMMNDLRTVCDLNVLFKYADDVNMLCPANAAVTPEQEI
jgi:hypothetical protein